MTTARGKHGTLRMIRINGEASPGAFDDTPAPSRRIGLASTMRAYDQIEKASPFYGEVV